jgi:cob(I)alamin adenosyltransferase
MGKRLTGITTRTGDDGTTGLGDGTRTHKDALRVHALGDVDELNSVLGVLACEDLPADVRAALVDIQHDLFDLGGELSIPGHAMVDEALVARLDAWIATYNATLPRLDEFILPGGSRAASVAHVARTVARRAERALVALGKSEDVRDEARHYLNRLSDLLFVLARVLNRHAGGADVQWRRDRDPG